MNIVNEELGVKLSLKEFFEHGNIRAIAKLIKSTSIAYACLWGIDWIMGLFG